MAPPRQQDTTALATSSHAKSQQQQSSSKNAKSTRSKKTKKRAEPVPTSAPRQPDEIEEAETTTIPSTQAPSIPTPSKQKPKRVESSDADDDDSDDAESVYLSDEDEEDSYDDESSSDESTDSGDSVEDLPPRQLARRSTTERDVKNASGSPFTITQTRSETTRWITTQNNGGMTRGTRSFNEQTTMHDQNVNGQRPRTNRNSVSFNMSINVDMSFNGLVTGRNLGFSGGSLSYAWNRRNTQGG
ncbi:hypothetical protein NW762_002462 [Fusarium torreyae]|uniref:Uncharacterized protein n=1 Tax=Fusarium torreyae TaxID=1237075 RepID=A0A9W8VMN0_9HYPO|nr:hypothetical protein NW762_002462 [Fusarium torreyae]